MCVANSLFIFLVDLISVITITFRNANNFTRSGSQNSNISESRPSRRAPPPPRTSGSGGVTERVSSRRQVSSTSASRSVIYIA